MPCCRSVKQQRLVMPVYVSLQVKMSPQLFLFFDFMTSLAYNTCYLNLSVNQHDNGWSWSHDTILLLAAYDIYEMFTGGSCCYSHNCYCSFTSMKGHDILSSHPRGCSQPHPLHWPPVYLKHIKDLF